MTDDLGIVERNRQRLDSEMYRDGQLRRIEEKLDEVLTILRLERTSMPVVLDSTGLIFIKPTTHTRI